MNNEPRKCVDAFPEVGRNATYCILFHGWLLSLLLRNSCGGRSIYNQHKVQCNTQMGD